MSYCLNPHCSHPHNAPDAQFCQSCGSVLVLQGMYRAIAPLGQGGFGRTFRAIHQGRFHQPCVIKQLWLESQSLPTQIKAIALFREEARRLFDLGQHPQIPALIAHFEVDQHCYLVQDLVEGHTLATELRHHGAFSPTQVEVVLRDLLPLLTFIHSQGVIHRDIKPDNLIRQPNGHLALVDFGAARVGSAAPHQPGTIIGSAGYAAPEQALGRATFASDLYSLGVTCIHLLTDTVPTMLFDGANNRFRWMDALQGRRVSDRLHRVLDRLLMPALGDRYASAAAVLADLDGPAPGLHRAIATSVKQSGHQSSKIHSLSCAQCRGTGLMPDAPQACLACAGSGQQLDAALQEIVCDLCGGSGQWVMSRVCSTCWGRGLDQGTRT